MKKFILSFALLFVAFGVYAQCSCPCVSNSVMSPLDSVLSGKKTAHFKITEYNMTNTTVNIQKMGMAGNVPTTIRTLVRKVVADNIGTAYFYVVKYGDQSASLSKQELVEMKGILSKLNNEATADANTKPDMLQNLYQTKGGVKIGYTIDEGKEPVWILKLNSAAELIKAKDFPTLEKVILDGLDKIDQVS